MVLGQIYGCSNFGHKVCLLAKLPIANSNTFNIKISAQLHVIEAQERHEMSPKKLTTPQDNAAPWGDT